MHADASRDRRAARDRRVATTPRRSIRGFVVDAVGMRVSRLVHAGLFRLDPDTLEPIPYLAVCVSVRRIRSTLDVELREDVRFHSGAPFASRDVVATIDAFAR